MLYYFCYSHVLHFKLFFRSGSKTRGRSGVAWCWNRSPGAASPVISVETARGRRWTLRTTCPRTAAPNTTSAPRRWSAALNYNSGAASSGACRSSPHVTTSAPLDEAVTFGMGRRPWSVAETILLPPPRYHYLKLTNYTRRLRKRQSICPCTTAPPATASSSPGGGVLEAETRRSRRTIDYWSTLLVVVTWTLEGNKMCFNGGDITNTNSHNFSNSFCIV